MCRAAFNASKANWVDKDFVYFEGEIVRFNFTDTASRWWGASIAQPHIDSALPMSQPGLDWPKDEDLQP